MSKAFRDLLVWQKAMDLTVAVYRVTSEFPKAELYGLTSQMRRSAASIPSNIAEGSGRATRRDFAQFVCIARGSNYELETQIELAGRLGFAERVAVEEILHRSADVGKLLKGLLSHLKAEEASRN